MERPAARRPAGEDGPRALRIGGELLALGLILASVAGSLALIVHAYRRGALPRPTPAVAVASPAVSPDPEPEPAPVPVATPEPEPEPEPAEPPDDPTARELERLAARTAEEVEATARATQEAEELGQARRAAEAESDEHRKKVQAVREQVEGLARQAQEREIEAETIALERDVLARRRDEAKEELTQARARAGSYAVLPFRGPNGTWKYPIAIECSDGVARLQPNGPAFSLMSLASSEGLRASPFLAAISRAVVRTQARDTPDGRPAVPYLLFVVRPDGIRPYYEARALLEPLGITFGYELVEQDWQIDYPDDAAPDSSDPADSIAPELAEAFPRLRGAAGAGPNSDDNPYIWPSVPPGGPGGADLDGPILGGGPGGSGLAGGTDRGPGGGGPDRGDPLGRTGALGTSGASGPGRDGSPSPRGTGTGLARGPSVFASPGSGRPAGGGSGGGMGHFARGTDGLPADGLPGDGNRKEGELARGAGGPAGPTSALPAPRLGGTGNGMGGDGVDPSGAARPPGTTPEGSTPGGAGEWARSSPGLHRGGAGNGQAGGGSAVGGSPSAGSAMAGGGSPGIPALGSGPAGAPDKPKGIRMAPGTPEDRRPDKPLELIVACGPRGVVIHPGGYRLTNSVLAAGGDRFERQLKAIVKIHEVSEPNVIHRPQIRFVIEPGGQQTYWNVRRQTILTGLGWPVSLQVADAAGPAHLPWRRR